MRRNPSVHYLHLRAGLAREFERDLRVDLLPGGIEDRRRNAIEEHSEVVGRRRNAARRKEGKCWRKIGAEQGDQLTRRKRPQLNVVRRILDTHQPAARQEINRRHGAAVSGGNCRPAGAHGHGPGGEIVCVVRRHTAVQVLCNRVRRRSIASDRRWRRPPQPARRIQAVGQPRACSHRECLPGRAGRSNRRGPRPRGRRREKPPFQ